MVVLQPRPPLLYTPGAARSFAPVCIVRDAGATDSPKPRLLDRLRQAIRARHYSHRTEKTYVHWVRRYVLFHGKRHPAEMGVDEITAFPPF